MTGVCPARCVGAPLSWPSAVGFSGIVLWPVWAWLVVFGPFTPSPTPFVPPPVCFVVARPFVACPRVRLLRCCQHYVWLVLAVAVVFAD